MQLTGSGPWSVVELDADDAALLYLHIRAPDVAGEQVHGKLVQAGSMPGQGYGLLPLVGLQGYDDFFWWDVGLQGGEFLRRRPAGLFGQDLRGPPRPFVGAAQENLYFGDDTGQPAGSPLELFLALRRERTPAVIRPAFLITLVGDSVADEIDVQADLPNTLVWYVSLTLALQNLLELLPLLALGKGEEGFRAGYVGA